MKVLAVDLGTSAVKSLVVDGGGEVVATASIAYATLHPEPGAAEQDPETWWNATIQAVHELGEATTGISALGLSGQMHGTVALDEHQHPIGPAIIWSDTRSAAVLQDINTNLGREWIATEIGSPLATGFQAVTLGWLQRERADVWACVRYALTPKDYLRWRLTGRLASEPSDAAGTGLLSVQARAWSQQMLSALSLSQTQRPPILESAAISGHLTVDAAQELGLPTGVPVVGGGADAPLAALAAGIAGTESVMVTLSSGAQVVRFSDHPLIDRQARLHTFAAPLNPARGEAGWYIMGAIMAAGSALHWLRDNILRSDVSVANLLEAAETVPAGAGGLLFAPYLSGERSPHMDPLARASFLGLIADHDVRHMTRAIVEGAVYALRDAYGAVADLTGPATSVVLAGGGARSSLWRQSVADIFGLTVIPSEQPDLSAMGAAILAMAGITGSRATDIATQWATYGRPVEPIAKNQVTFERLRPVFRSMYDAHRTQFAELARPD